MEDGKSPGTSGTAGSNSVPSSVPSSPVSALDTNAEAGPSRPINPRKKTAREQNPFASSATRWYTTDLIAHAASSRAQLEGRSKLFTSSTDIPDDDVLSGLRASVVPPATTWQVDEKCRFFAALSRHSRLRPDLIAADVGTKNVVQVQRYLSLLDKSSKRKARRYRPADARAFRDHHLRSGAYQVDKDWINREDEFAECIEQACEYDQLLNPRIGQHPFVKWGHDLTLSKMQLLHRTLSIVEAEAKAADFTTSNPVIEDTTSAETPIEQDDREIAFLEDIPTKERSDVQRSRLRTLKNRRQNRQRYRRKQLHSMGFSNEVIDAHGGPDQFLQRTGYAETGGAPRKEVRSSQPLAPATEMMVDVKMDEYLTRRGWEIFHFQRLSETMAIYHGEGLQTEPSTSFELIGDLFDEVLMYVRQLVYTTLVLAEQEPDGEPPLREVNAEHVRAAQALRGEQQPSTVIQAALRKLSQLGGLEGDSEPDEPPDEGLSAGLSSVTPSDSNASTNRSSHSRRSQQSVPDDLSSWQSLEKPVVVPPEDGEAPYRRTLTDDEDEDLDAALEEADVALDALLDAQLHSAADHNDKDTLVDDQVWFESYRGNARSGKQKFEPSLDHLNDLRDAQEKYGDLVNEVFVARRKRGIARRRTEKFPWYQGYLLGGRLRNKKSHILVDESDDEGEPTNLSDDPADHNLEVEDEDGTASHTRDYEAIVSVDDKETEDDDTLHEEEEMLEDLGELSESGDEQHADMEPEESNDSDEETMPHSTYDDVVLFGDDALDSDSD